MRGNGRGNVQKEVDAGKNVCRRIPQTEGRHNTESFFVYGSLRGKALGAAHINHHFVRILLFTQYFWPENFRINDLVPSLVNSGINVTVVTGKPNYPDGRIFAGYRAAGILHERHEGAEVLRMPLVPRGKASRLRLTINYLSFILSGYLLAPFALRGRRFDAVFVYAPSPLLQALPAIFIAWIKRAPLVVWVQDLWPESVAATGFVRGRFVLTAIEWIVRYIYRHSDMILVQSEAFRTPVSRLVDDVRKIRYYPNSVEDIFVKTGDNNGAGGIAEVVRDNFSVVFAGNIGTAQSIETIVDAAERLKTVPGVRFFLFGSGSRAAWLAEEIKRRKLDNIVFAGRVPIEDMPAILGAATGLLVTLKREEIFSFTIPSKVQAYLAVGKPVIACLNGEGARIVSEAEAGFVCAAGDASGLADAVLRLRALSRNERARLGENGQRYFREHYEKGRLVSELIGMFRSLSNNGGGSKR